MAASRREARERALELLYEAEQKGISSDELLAELPVAPDAFTVRLVVGVAQDRERLAAEISKRLRDDWDLGRLGLIDRLVLMLGLWELLHEPETPRAVVLAEATELASRFSGQPAAKFVNGLLATASSEL